MLTREDCIGLCDLTEDEIAAIAEHERMPDVIATELGAYLVHSPKGVPMIRRMIIDDIENARRRGDTLRALKLKAVLWHFAATHPEEKPADA